MKHLPITLNGKQVIKLELHVPNQGVWFAYCDLAEQLDLSGKVTIGIGDTSLSGTIDASYSGAFSQQSKYLVVGGANSWGRIVKSRSYHNDAQVSVRTVLSDLATEVGELLGNLDLPNSKFAIDYIRKAGYASKVLEDCAQGAAWWVDFDGTTNIGTRKTSSADSFTLLNYDPITKEATIGLTDFPFIGSTITDPRLDAPITIREMIITADGENLLAKCWCDDNTTTKSRLAATIQNIVTRCSDQKLWGKYRYRVLSQSTDGRLSLQAVNKSAGIPDAILVPVVSGVAGVHTEWTPGAIVVVDFLEGSADLPRVTGTSEYDQSGCFLPKSMDICVGPGKTGKPIAGIGDTVDVFFPPEIPIAGTSVVLGAFTGVLTIVTSAPGIITSGSDLAKVGSS